MIYLPRFALVAALTTAGLQAQQPQAADGPVQPSLWQTTRSGYAANYALTLTHSADSQLNRAGRPFGDFNASQLSLDYTVLFQPSDTYSWGVGGRWDHARFDVPAGMPAPEHGYALALGVTSNWRFAEKWSLRTDLRPGLYTDFEDLSGDDFNVPFTVILGHQLNRELTLVAGLNANLRSDLPLVGGPGLIWRFAEGWRLFATPPKPQVEYSPNDKLTLFAGAELKGIVFRVAENFGDGYGEPALNNDTVSYRELRAGGGARWQFSRALQLTVEGGYAWDRRFQFNRSNVLLNGDGAPYLGIALSGSY